MISFFDLTEEGLKDSFMIAPWQITHLDVIVYFFLYVFTLSFIYYIIFNKSTQVCKKRAGHESDHNKRKSEKERHYSSYPACKPFVKKKGIAY